VSLIQRGECYVCRDHIIYNILLVPNIGIDGERVPLCKECVEYANPIRAAKGLPTFKVFPGAYGPFNDEWHFRFNGRIGWPVIETPQPRRIVGWREEPDLHKMFGEIYWAVELVAKESEDIMDFIGTVEEK